MEYIALGLGVIVGVTVAFFIITFYRLGVKDGRDIKRGAAPQPLVQKKTKTTESEASKDTMKAYKNLFGYDPFKESVNE